MGDLHFFAWWKNDDPATRQAVEDAYAVEALLADCIPPDRRPLASRLFDRLRKLFRPASPLTENGPHA